MPDENLIDDAVTEILDTFRRDFLLSESFPEDFKNALAARMVGMCAAISLSQLGPKAVRDGLMGLVRRIDATVC